MEGSVMYQFTYYVAVIIVSMLSTALLLNSPAARTARSRVTIVYFSSFFAAIAIGYIFMLFIPALGKLFAIGVVNLLILIGLYCLRIGLIWRKGQELHLWQAPFAIIHIVIFTVSQVTAEALLPDAYWFRLANTSANGLLIVLGCLNLLSRGVSQSNYGENIARFSFILLMITLSMLPVLYQALTDTDYYYVAITVLIVVNIFALMGGLQSLLMTDVIDYHYQTSIKDPLTGIFNRRYFFQSVTGMTTNNEEHGSHSVILCDIDKFKQFNDKYGHDIGDDILVKFAVMLRETVGKQGIVSRYGGEEFSILLHQHSLPNAVEFAEKLRQNCERLLVKCDDQMVNVTASFGVAEVWQLSDIDLALKLADDALLRAKASGRNRVVSN